MSRDATPLVEPSPPAASPAAGRRALGWLVALLLFAAGAALRCNDVAELSVCGDEIYTIWETRTARRASAQADVATSWQQRLELITAKDPAPPPGVPSDELWRLRWGYRTNPLFLIGNEAAVALRGDSPGAFRFTSLLYGLAALALFPLLARSWLGDRGALLLLALLAFAPNPVEFSRLARYQSATFFFGGVAALASIRFQLRRRLRDELLCLAACLGMVASHLTSVPVAGCLFLWMAIVARGRASLTLLLPAAAGAVAAWYFGPHQKVSTTISEGIGAPGIYRWYQLAASLVYNFGPGLLGLGLLGVVIRRREEARPILGLAVAAVVPTIVLFWLNRKLDVGARYFGSIEAVGFLLAVVGLSRLLAAPPPARLARALAALLFLAQTPVLASNAIDGQRYPYAEVARCLAPRLAPEDRVLADWSGILDYYFASAHHLERKSLELPGTLVALEERLTEGDHPRAFVVFPRQRGRLAFPGSERRMTDWLAAHATPIATFGHRRLDSWLNPIGAGYWFELAVYEIDATTLRGQ